MNQRLLIFLWFVALIFSLSRCDSVFKEDKVIIDSVAFQKLSDYHFFIGDIRLLKPSKELVPYALITPLFTDYAHKARFLYMPKDKSVDYNDKDVLDFPIGSCLIKNFYYQNDERDSLKGRRIIETRLLIHRTDGWEALPYIWNDEQTEAFLKLGGGDKKVSWIDMHGQSMSVNYSIPNKNQCKGCHWNNGELTPIGPKIRNLNFKLNYPDGSYRNQLDKWASLGILKKLSCPATSPLSAKWDDSTTGSIQDRAIAYLENNCGHCHRNEGPAATSGLILTTLERNPTKLGIFKTPIAAGIGSVGALYDIVPGQPDSSILYLRMNSIHPGIMMPELGRHLIHVEGVALIRAWILSMNPEAPLVFHDEE
jgi:uncharacterized repeat protein (TIGR03806 family)